MKDKSFFIYFMNKTGGLYNPQIAIKMIEALKEWLPDEEESRGPTDAYADGWNSYRKQITEKLK